MSAPRSQSSKLARYALIQIAVVLGIVAVAFAQQLTILPTSLPMGTVGQGYFAYFTLSSTTNVLANWAITSGSPPPGITMNCDGEGYLCGIPTQAGKFVFTVTATPFGTAGPPPPPVSQQYTLLISTGQPLTIGQAAFNPRAAVGAPYTTTLVAGGGVPGYTWALANANTNGLSIDPMTGTVSGTPQTSGSTPLTAVVTDAAGAQASYTFTLNVIGIDTTSPLPSGSIGNPYSKDLAVSGAFLPVSWTLISGSLPPGLSLTSSGQISGTPTQNGTYTFTVGVVDSIQNSTSKVFTMAVNTQLTITPASLPNGPIGIAYSQTLSANGGTAPYHWSVSGQLPPGVTLDPLTGIISGTPTAIGPFAFTATVNDSVNNTGSANFTINIDTLAIATSSLPPAFTNVNYNAQLALAGGQPNVAWALAAGSLPAGLSLNASTGAITGTPAAAGSFPITISATYTLASPNPVSVQKAFTLTVSAAPVVTVTGLPSTGTPAQQPAASVGLSGGTYGLDINGTLTLTFVSSVGGDDQMVKFSNGTRTASFTIPAGSTQGTFGGASTVSVLTGTVAGTITITTALTDTAGHTLPPPAPIVITINAGVPVITKVTITSVTGGFNVAVTGFSTTRDMSSALFHFAPTTGTNLAATDVTVPLSGPFSAWYGSSASNAFGSQFTMVVPFTFTGPGGTTFPVAAVTVTLTNSKGSSAPSAPANP
jgi:hypothetical protein